MKKITLFLIAIIMTVFACRKDVDEVTTTTTNYVPEFLERWEQPILNVTGTLIVQVVDDAGHPVIDAEIVMGNRTAATDNYGHAFFRDVQMNHLGTFIKVNHHNFFSGSRRFFPEDGAETRVRVELIRNAFDHSFASQDGGTVSLNGGASITFPANSIQAADGTPYNGIVKAAAHWLDPSNPRTLERMPGNLQGINAQGEEVVMATFGMVVAELQDESGNPLNILEGKTATIKMPVPAGQLAIAPAEIPLWSYHDDYGVWAEEGKATLQNGVYVGEVAHFSFWNCDYPYPLVNFTATFLNEAGEPLVNYWVRLTPSTGWAGWGITDNNGTTGGKVPKDELFTLAVTGQCGEELYSIEIGPFSADVDLGQIVVPNSALNPTTLSGQLVDCDGLPLTNGLAIFQFDGQTVYEYTTTGSFDLTFSTCAASADITVTGVNLDAVIQSNPVTASAGTNSNLGQISVCGVQLENYIRITIDGVTGICPLANASQDSSSFVDGTILYSYGQQNSAYVYLDVAGQTVGSYGGATSNAIWGIYDDLKGWSINGQQFFSTFEITQYGANIGDHIIGNFSGTVDNYATQPPQAVTISGDFNIIRDF